MGEYLEIISLIFITDWDYRVRLIAIGRCVNWVVTRAFAYHIASYRGHAHATLSFK